MHSKRNVFLKFRLEGKQEPLSIGGRVSEQQRNLIHGVKSLGDLWACWHRRVKTRESHRNSGPGLQAIIHEVHSRQAGRLSSPRLCRTALLLKLTGVPLQPPGQQDIFSSFCFLLFISHMNTSYWQI